MLGLAEILISAGFGLFLMFMLITIVSRNRRGRDAAPPIIDDEYEAIRQKVAARYKRWGELALHFVLFVGLSLAFVFILRIPRTASLLLIGAWLLVLVAHSVKVLFDEAQERAVDREIARMRDEDSWDKPKRTRMELTDDGELVEMDTWDDEEKLKHET